jgi:hypothetical protein
MSILRLKLIGTGRRCVDWLREERHLASAAVDDMCLRRGGGTKGTAS